MISVVIPVYNVKDYFDASITSLINQTYKDFEVVLVDDGSTDGSSELCDFYAAKDSRIRVIHTPNQGVSEARNTGLRNAKGDYIYFLDSDDIMTPDCLELMLEQVRLHPGVDVVCAGEWVPKGHGLRHFDFEQYPTTLPSYTEDKYLISYALFSRKSLAMMVHNRLVRHDLIRENDLYFVPGVINEDEIWTFVANKYIRSIAVVPRNTMYYTVRPGSIMTSQFTFYDYLYVANWMADHVGGELEEVELRMVFSFIFANLCNKKSPLRIYHFKSALKTLLTKGTRRQKLGVWLLLHSPLPSRMRRIHGLRLPKKLVGKVKPYKY